MRGSPLVLKEFHGVNLAADPLDLPLGVAQSLSNVEPNGRGGLHRREAMLSYFATPLFAEDLFSGVFSDIYMKTSTTFETVGGPTIQSGMTPSKSVGALGPKTTAGTALAFYMTDQVNTPKFYDGSTTANWTATTGAIPRANLLTFAGGRMFAADILGDPIRRIRASAPGDPYSWGTAVGQGYAVDLDLNDSGPTTGLVAVGPYVLVFTQTSIYVIYDLDTGANRPLSRVEGAASAGRSERYVTSDGQVAYFLNRDGIFSTDGSRITKLSSAIAPGDPRQTLGYLAWLSGYLILSTSATSDFVTFTGRMYVLDQETGEWWIHDSAARFGPAIRQAGNPNDALVLQRGTDHEVVIWRPNHRHPFTAFGTTDGTLSPSTYTASWVGGVQDFGYPAIKKRIRSMEAAGLVAAGALNMGADRDGVTVAPRAFALGSSRSVAKIPTWGAGRLWTPSLSDTTTSRWQLDEIEMDWQPRKG